MRLEKPQSQYTRQPNEKITLAEAQALLSAGIMEATLPLRVVCRWAVIADRGPHR